MQSNYSFKPTPSARLNSGVRRALFASVASAATSAAHIAYFGRLGDRAALVSSSPKVRRASAASSAIGQAGKTCGLELRAFAVWSARVVPRRLAGDQRLRIVGSASCFIGSGGIACA